MVHFLQPIEIVDFKLKLNPIFVDVCNFVGQKVYTISKKEKSDDAHHSRPN